MSEKKPEINYGGSEGIYIGLAGETKRLYETIYNQQYNHLLNVLGLFFRNHFKPYDAEDKAKIAEIYENFECTWKHANHSGGSAIVTIQQLFDILGSRCLDDATYKYIRNMEAKEL